MCDWCLVSDGLVAGLAALALLRLRSGYRPPTRTAAFPQLDP